MNFVLFGSSPPPPPLPYIQPSPHHFPISSLFALSVSICVGFGGEKMYIRKNRFSSSNAEKESGKF